jgi:glycosyltransferase involved in cell wall biosynthesis
MKLAFWHNLISPHQAPLMRELALAGHEVLVVASEAMSAERRQLGWSAPALGPAQIVLGPDQTKVAQIVKSGPPDTVHFIAGARGTALGQQVAHACRRSRRRMGLITESPDARGLGGPLRWAKYSGERISMGKHFDFILAMGQRGTRWFKLCGYPAARIFPFAYVTERYSGYSGERVGNGFRFLFVGQLIARKGVDVLLRALAKVPGCELAVIGDGPEEENLKKVAAKCGVADRVSWRGKMDSTKAQSQIAEADVLVLPSREDGWGAVVNEALMAGTPVICSTACGAADLIRYPWLGTVFRSGNVAELANALSSWTGRGKLLGGELGRIRSWSQCIEGSFLATYVERVLVHVYERGPRPTAPWRLDVRQAALPSINAYAEL